MGPLPSGFHLGLASGRLQLERWRELGKEVDVFNPMTSSSFPGAGLQWLLFFS